MGIGEDGGQHGAFCRMFTTCAQQVKTDDLAWQCENIGIDDAAPERFQLRPPMHILATDPVVEIMPVLNSGQKTLLLTDIHVVPITRQYLTFQTASKVLKAREAEQIGLEIWHVVVIIRNLKLLHQGIDTDPTPYNQRHAVQRDPPERIRECC